MRRTAYVAAGALLLLLSGCTAAEDAASARPPSVSAPSPSTEPSPSASVPGADPADPAAWVIDAEGMGPLRLGMPIADARAALPDDESCHDWAYFARAGDSGSQSIVYAETDGVVRHIESSLSDGPRTAAGLGVGSTRADVLAAYPDAVFEPRNIGWLQSGSLLFGFTEGITYDGAGGQTDDRTPEDLVVAVAVTAIGAQYEFCG